jgi:hypothetical protein
MSQEEDNSKEILKDNSIKLGQLVRDILQVVNAIFPSTPDLSFENMVAQFYVLRSEIKKIDPSWKFENTDTRYVFEILMLLDAINTEEIPDLQQNVKICQRLFHRVRIMRQINPAWNLDIEGIMKFLYPTLNTQHS